jgi:ATPase subunit of ABC transporter with duplicated ATPase domains
MDRNSHAALLENQLTHFMLRVRIIQALMYNFEVHDSEFLPYLSCQLSLVVEKQSSLLIKGPNGVGKSTLLKRLHRDYKHKMALSFIEQPELDIFYDRGLDKFLSIFKDINRDFLDENFMNRAREFFALPMTNSSVTDLSGGEKQCLKLLLGLSKRAEVYLLDEPSQYLDQARKEILGKLILEKEKTSSLIIVEHDVSYLHSPKQGVDLERVASVLKAGHSWST